MTAPALATRTPQSLGPQTRDFAIPAEAIDREARTVELAFSSETPYERWWGTEILSHERGAMRLDRMAAGAALLVDHNTRDQVGVVVRAWIGDDRIGRAVVRFSRSTRGEEVFQDVIDGIRKLVSVGYRIHDLVLEQRNDAGETYRVTDWEPHEVSIVAVPADPTVGVGRDAGDITRDPASIIPEQHPLAGRAGQHHPQERTMPQQVEIQAPAAAPQPDLRVIENQAVAAERARTSDIRALGESHQQRVMADAAIANGQTVEQFRASLLDKLVQAGTLKPAESPEIGMSARELQRFSFRRLFLAAMDPLNAQAQRDAAFEREASDAARAKQGDRKTDREGGITIPIDVLNADASVFGRDYARAQAAALIAKVRDPAYRDLVVGTATAGGHLVSTDLLSASFINLLRARTRVIDMGATLFTDLNGNLAIPRQTGGASIYWVAENGAPTESGATFDQVTLSPKTIGAFTDYSRRLLLQSSLDVEAFVRTDLALGVGVGLDAAAINGSGSSNQPTGVLNLSGIGSVAGGTNGLAPTWDHMVDLEAQVANANADFGSLGYLTNSKVRSKLKRTQKFASTNGQEIWMTGRDPRGGIGEINGYDAYVSNNVPSTLDKGTSTGVCSAVVFGDWSALLIGMWGGLDVMLDPYTGSTAGTKRVVALQDVDIAARRAASFAAMKDALTV